MKITCIKCPKCDDLIFSRFRHDFRHCSCGDCYIDGGFDYLKFGFKKEIPDQIQIDIDVTKKVLYDDWNFKQDKYGIIKKSNLPE